jgi:hypothetical protein
MQAWVSSPGNAHLDLIQVEVPGSKVKFLTPAFQLRLEIPAEDGAIKRALRGP